MNDLKLISVVGARPNFMKIAPIVQAICRHNAKGRGPFFKHLLVHTGQHYDPIMSDQFFRDLHLPKPDVHLGAESGSPGMQTGDILKKFEEVLIREKPNMVIVVGDVNSTLACALATAKLPVEPGQQRPLLAHVEAGLRSFDRMMPEEINRIATDHVSDLLFVTEKSGLANLHREGIPPRKVFFVGNTMIDSLVSFKAAADASGILERLGLMKHVLNENKGISVVRPYALLTLHRPANVDDRKVFHQILKGIAKLSKTLPVIFPVHPRTKKRIQEFGLEDACQGKWGDRVGIRLVDPLGYLDFLATMKSAKLVLTDSGGIQEETTVLGIPCVTIRENTERPVTVKEGTNILAGISAPGIRRAIARQLSQRKRTSIPEKWDGKAAQRIVSVLTKVN